MNPMSQAYLILENGQVYQGHRFGAPGQIQAELVFTTGMVGYLETLTDPSYHGEIVVQTFPLIGNYGVIPHDFESDRPRLSAYVVRQVCAAPSNFRSEGALDDYLRQQGVIGLCGVDTRQLTRTLRESGVMNAAIVDQLPDDMEAFTQALAARSLSSDVYQVTCSHPYTLGEGRRHVVLWDFGLKRAMAQALMERGCRLTVMPAGSTAEEVLRCHPDGILLSNGPGDPVNYREIVSQVGLAAAKGVPMMGICLGHQLLALSQGAGRVKLKYGHRGANQPVRRLSDKKLFVTCQNHGYAILNDTLPDNAKPSYENINDLTNEGIEYQDKPAFSVQFHPEACAGPQDTAFLFDQFIQMMED